MIDRFTDPRFVITLLILCIFAWSFGENVSDETMKGAVISALNLAIGYWLGSSRGSADNAVRADKALDIAHAATTGPSGTPSDPVSVVEQPR